MTEKELQKLNRRRLLELLLIQTERADSLEAELEDTKSKLQSKLLSEKESGSIAEAALKLNGVFEAADAAAAQYLENIRNACEYQEKLKRETEEKARLIIENAEADAEKIRLDAEKMLEDARRRSAGITRKMRKK